MIFLSASLAKKLPDGKMQKKESQQKRNMISYTFFLLFILPSALTLNETPSDPRGRSFISHFKRIKHILMIFVYALCVRFRQTVSVCVCVCLSAGCSDGEAPLMSLPFVQSRGDPHHQKSMRLRAYVRLCVCQGFVRQISLACAALVLLNQASITRPL